MDAFALVRSRRVLVAAAMLAVSTFAALLLIVTQAQAATGSGTLSCRASAIRYGDPPVEPLVANPNYTPCATRNAVGGGAIVVPGLLSVSGSREAHTLKVGFGSLRGGYASAQWGAVVVRIGTLGVKANVLKADASSTCANGLQSSSEVAGLQVGTFIGPFFVPTILNLPLVTGHLHLGLPNGVALDVNKTEATSIGGVTGVRQQALAFTTPNREVVLGEAMAGGNNCLT